MVDPKRLQGSRSFRNNIIQQKEGEAGYLIADDFFAFDQTLMMGVATATASAFAPTILPGAVTLTTTTATATATANASEIQPGAVTLTMDYALALATANDASITVEQEEQTGDRPIFIIKRRRKIAVAVSGMECAAELGRVDVSVGVDIAADPVEASFDVELCSPVFVSCGATIIPHMPDMLDTGIPAVTVRAIQNPTQEQLDELALALSLLN